MNFLADENLDQQIVARLRQDGYLVWYVAEMEPRISDDVLLDLANQEETVLMTADKEMAIASIFLKVRSRLFSDNK